MLLFLDVCTFNTEEHHSYISLHVHIHIQHDIKKPDGPQYENSYLLEPPKKPTKKELTMMFQRVLADVHKRKKFWKFSEYTLVI